MGDFCDLGRRRGRTRSGLQGRCPFVARPTWHPTNVWMIENYVGVQTAVNEGALFGMGAGFGSLFALLSVLAGAGILVWLGWFGAIESCAVHRSRLRHCRNLWQSSTID